MNVIVYDFDIVLFRNILDAVSVWRKTMGHRDSRISKDQDPSSIRACYGVDEIQNACHG
jgi:nucleoside diphosphate kinase